VDRPPLSVRFGDFGRRLRRIDPRILDAALTVALLAVAVPSMWARDGGNNFRFNEPGPVAVLLAVASVVPLYFRRRAPLASLVVATIPVLFITGLDYQTAVVSQTLLIAVYSVGAYAASRDRAYGLAFIVVALFIARFVAPDLGNAGLALNFAIFAAAYLFGSTVRNRRLYMAELEERAVALEHERDEQSKRAVADERLRIAQDLHDVVAHSMGVIAVQAGVGAHVIDSDPAEAKKALEAISHTSRTTLSEIRRMLGVLRADSDAEYAPAPGLADLDKLVRDVRAAGIDVDVRAEGDPNPDLPPGVEFTAYRIVQEALTNVIKHAGKARAVVVVRHAPAALGIEVTDDGRGINGHTPDAKNGRTGHGLMGMRERVGVYGGAFEAGPRTGGGFRVAATLPYGAPE
jgi:signal transduction histidine kinase